jgi:hypothetical protein
LLNIDLIRSSLWQNSGSLEVNTMRAFPPLVTRGLYDPPGDLLADRLSFLAEDAAQIGDLPCGTVNAELGRRAVERVEQGFLEIFVIKFPPFTPAPREQGGYAAFRIDAKAAPRGRWAQPNLLTDCALAYTEPINQKCHRPAAVENSLAE